jgi:uncharacterized membrane protein YhdT
VNFSISFYDNASSEYCVWQDWDETTDLPDGTPSDNYTWMEDEWNTTTYWGLLGISGDALDFEDPVEAEPTPSEQLGDTGLISKVIAGLTIIFVALALLYWIVVNYIQKQRKTLKDMMEMFKLIVIVLVMLVIIATIIAVF